MADQIVTLRLKADASNLSSEVKKAAKDVKDIGDAAQEAGSKFDKSWTKAGGILENLGNEAEKAANKTEDLTAATKEAKAANDAATKSTNESALAIGTVVGVVTAAATAFGVLVASEVEYSANLVVTSKRIGTSVELLSTLGVVARRNDADLGAIVSALDSVGEAAARASAGVGVGGKQTSAAFAALGVSVKTATGQIKPTTVLLEDVAKALAKLPEGALKARLASQTLGGYAAELDGTLRELADVGLQGVVDKATEAGQVISATAAAKAKELTDDIQTLQERASTMANNFGQVVVPVILDLATALAGASTQSKGFGEESTALRTIVEDVGLAVLVTKETFSTLFTMLYGGIDAIGGIGDVFNGLLSNLGHAANATGAAVIGDYRLMSEEGTAAANALADGWETGSNRVKSAIGAVTSAGAESDAAIKKYQDNIAARNERIAKTAEDAAKRMAEMNARGQFQNVTSGVNTVSGEDAAKNAAAIAAQEAYEKALERTTKAKGSSQTASHALEQAENAQARAVANLVNITGALTGQIDPMSKAWEAHAASLRKIGEEGAKAIEAYGNAVTAAAAAHTELNSSLLTTEQVQGQVAAAVTAENAAFTKVVASVTKARDIGALLNKGIAEQKALIGLSGRALAVYQAGLDATALAQKEWGDALDPEKLKEWVAVAQAGAGEISDMSKEADSFQSYLDGFDKADWGDNLITKLQKIRAELADTTDPDRIKLLNAALSDTRTQLVQGIAGGAIIALDAIGSMAEEGSRTAEALSLATQALTIVDAIAAIVHQASQGDVYTAIPRMIAVAAAIASLGVKIGSFAGGGFSDTAKKRQETQGTGSVLGDVTAKSESIANAVEITANATEQLVGINRGMLNALNTLVAGLGSAANMLARGAGQADFSGQNLAVGQAGALNGIHGTAIDPFGFFGGSSKVTDEGIIIFGGALNDMLDSIAVGAYQEVQSRSWAFGSTHTAEGFSAVSDEFATQFQLIIGSIIDTVKAGAEALGILPADVEAALAAYKVEEIRISLKDLKPEEAQAELQAVFSSLFDGLAGAVVPFIGQFQKIGEGLGETLVRVATEVQVMQEAIRYLGLTVNETDPEAFAKISDGLIQMSGGIDAFIQNMTTFMNAFATDEFQLQTATTSLKTAFEEVGLAVPGTRDEMFALMQTLDATTEAGRKQIATLLRLAGTADQYYSLVEKAVNAATEFLDKLGLSSSGLSDFGKELLDITTNGKKAADAANTIAKAQGRAGASSIQLAKITQWTADQIIAATRRLMQQTQDLIAQLYGGLPSSLDAINSRITELENVTGGLADGIGSIEDASASLFDAWANGVKTVQDYLDSMLLGDLSALSPEEQLAEAQRQLIAMQALAVGGDANALSQLPQLADAFLRLLQGSGASGADYNTGFQWVRDLLTSVVNMQNPGTQAGGGPAPVELVPSAELIALYAARDAAEAAQALLDRQDLARQLAQNLADLAIILKVSVVDLITARGVDIRDLATDVGVDFDNLGAQSVTALGFLSSTLGITMTDLAAQLGISLTDLKGGLTEITTSVGIDLANLTVASTQSLAGLAGSLGMNLTEIATALDVNLGALTDANSLINDALGNEIGALPEGQRAELEPLFQAITDATTQADANAAIDALESAVNLIGGETANALAPFLDGVFPVRALEQLDYLADIQRIAGEQLDILGFIRDNLKAVNVGAGLPSYAVGTGYVNGNQIAGIHNGEAVVPANVNAWFRNAGWALPGASNDGEVVVALRAIGERLESLERSNNAGHDKTAQTVNAGDGRAMVQRDDISRRDQTTGRSRSA